MAVKLPPFAGSFAAETCAISEKFPAREVFDVAP